jgi:cysteine-rich repeat protein
VNRRFVIPLACAALLPIFACTDDASDTGTTASTSETDNGDGDPGDGDGDPGDGDGDPGDGDGDSGDGDGEPMATCGDGIAEGDEQCDDGNATETDDCTNACMTATCGDGIVYESVEECDDGNDVDADACTTTCILALCGDGIVQEGSEVCDDGNPTDTDDCTNLCESAVCGDGIVHENVEECDDQNADDVDACTTQCLNAICGDGIVQENVEECDDQNEINTDACVDGCFAAICGDGFVQDNVETCDDEDICNDTCDGLVILPYCIDYHLADPNAPNGMYMIDPDGLGANAPYDVYCDMSAGGHTVWAVTHDWGEWGNNMTIVIRDRLANGVGTPQDWTSTCQLFNTTNYAGGWHNTGQTYSQMQWTVWADANDYWLNYAEQMFPSITYNDILILQDWLSPSCWAHYAEAGCMTAFESPGGAGYAFCRSGEAASKRYHIYLCL